ncbi:MAG: glutathione S-transferase family protein [Myxococcales bacterium]|nr:glutathione S-transferase family protein [Myxococcales bacterium]
MAITLYHHPFSRAATVLWMLEEVGVPFTLEFVDFTAGAHKSPDMLARNPMGKLPVLVDDDVVVTEVAAIGLYLADRYAPGRLAPALDDPARGTYFRWALFAPSVIEPGAMAKAAGWDYKPGQAGWGTHDAMLDTMEAAIGPRTWLLGETFSMADVIFGGTLRYMLRFGMLEPRPAFAAYAERLGDRPAAKAADARNAAVVAERGLGK